MVILMNYYEAYDQRYKILHQNNKQCFSNTPTPILLDILQHYHISKQSHILELGCGEGRDAFYLLKNNYNLLATDISKEAIHFCQNKGYSDSFKQLNCLNESLPIQFDFIYAIALLHMFVRQEDRNQFYQFISHHLKDTGYALICSMGDGIKEYESNINQAFQMVKKDYEGETMIVPHTSCKIVSIETLRQELVPYFDIIKIATSSIPNEFSHILYAVIKRKE